MKICHIITTLGIGGAEKLLLYLAKEQSLSHEIHIIYLKNYDGLVDKFPKNVRIYHIPNDWKAFYKIRRIIKNINPHVLHSHLGHADWFSWVSTIGLPVKKIATIHSTGFKWNKTDLLISLFYRIFLYTIAKKAILVCVSSTVANFVKSNFGLPDSRIYIIPNGVPDIIPRTKAEQQQIRRSINIADDDFIIIFVGRLQYPKSVHTLVDAMSLITDNKLKCILVGDGNLRNELELQVEKLLLSDRVFFLGKQDQPDAYIDIANVLVLPSVFEGQPLVLLEAFRAGLPVITTELDTLKEVVTERYNGLFFEPENPQELAASILEFVENPLLREQMSINARNTFVEKYDIKKYVTRLEEIYESK
ncbi:Glycosyltransferase involved in cell wall bisynthesis [Flexibacter flexilis DSM 6793]|uniref:Glycosyltransferase involved in cell wall bisynthesis n=1 Tax=Flexibacter flexilis DSM 6793 TaxID=927664 RepID=A0A1I1FLE1_9BACT|nr:glycosyltransferase family 4 protein [Flexibacter flexilis]SFB98478.1 Glycosyltransferase involved in cell wall bisynthesis [Flexibacter flexilis DSM 6793]